MIITETNLRAIRTVFGESESSDESFSNDVIICMCASYYETHFQSSGGEFSQPLKDALYLLIAKTGKINSEPIYANFNDSIFIGNFIEYCLKKDYETALQNLMFYCHRHIENFESLLQEDIIKNFSKEPKEPDITNHG